MVAATRFAVPLALLGTILLWFLLLRPVLLGGPTSYVMVSGLSMVPTLHSGDLAVLRRQGSYEKEDIIAFRAEGAVVIHRITGGSAGEGYIVRGDNKDAPDLWRPKPDDILGKVWFYVPGGGRVFAYLRQPQRLAALVGGLAALSLFGGARVKQKRKRGGKMATRNGYGATGPLPIPAWAVAALSVLGLLALGLGAGAVLAYRQPTAISQTVERVRFEHVGAFDYTVQAEKSTLYPGGVVGPIAAASSDPGAKTTPPPIYRKLARSVDVGYTYSLRAPLPPDVSGEIGFVVEVRAADGWTTTLESAPALPFAGPRASGRATVDFARVSSLVDTVEKETGVRSGSYTVAVVPTVRVRGRVGAEPIDETYSTTFSVKLDQARVTPDAELTRAQPAKTSETVTREERVGLPGLALSVAAARQLGVAGAALCLAAFAALAGFFLLRLGRDEAARIRARYGSLLVTVAQADAKPGVRVVQVASMRDLARLAQQDGQIVFHQEEAGSDRYFVDKGEVTYQYTIARPGGEG